MSGANASPTRSASAVARSLKKGRSHINNMGERRTAVIITASIAVIVGLLLFWALAPSARDKVGAAPLTEVTDPAGVQNYLQLSHLSIATSENFARQKIYVVSGYLKNVSDRPVRMAELKMVFTDFAGKPILDYSQKVLDRNQKPLAPGTEFRFEVRQENLPRGWNYRVPITEVSKIGY